MIFKKAEPNENYPMLRYLSQGKNWEVGLTPMLFGVRIRASRTNDPCCAVDYCAGDDIIFQRKLLATVIVILSEVPESAETGYVEKLFPTYRTKPISNDPCWTELQRISNRILSAQSQDFI